MLLKLYIYRSLLCQVSKSFNSIKNSEYSYPPEKQRCEVTKGFSGNTLFTKFDVIIIVGFYSIL